MMVWLQKLDDPSQSLCSKLVAPQILESKFDEAWLLYIILRINMNETMLVTSLIKGIAELCIFLIWFFIITEGVERKLNFNAYMYDSLICSNHQ